MRPGGSVRGDKRTVAHATLLQRKNRNWRRRCGRSRGGPPRDASIRGRLPRLCARSSGAARRRSLPRTRRAGVGTGSCDWVGERERGPGHTLANTNLRRLPHRDTGSDRPARDTLNNARVAGSFPLSPSRRRRQYQSSPSTSHPPHANGRARSPSWQHRTRHTRPARGLAPPPLAPDRRRPPSRGNAYIGNNSGERHICTHGAPKTTR